MRKLLDLERGAVAFVIQPIGVAELLRAPLAIAAARAEKRGVGYEWSVPSTMPRVRVDLSHMQEALTSALGLAIDQTPEGGRIALEVRESQRRIARACSRSPTACSTPSFHLRDCSPSE